MQSREKMNIDLTPILNHRSSWRKSPVFELLAGGLDGDKELPGYPYSTLEEGLSYNSIDLYVFISKYEVRHDSSDVYHTNHIDFPQ